MRCDILIYCGSWWQVSISTRISEIPEKIVVTPIVIKIFFQYFLIKNMWWILRVTKVVFQNLAFGLNLSVTAPPQSDGICPCLCTKIPSHDTSLQCRRTRKKLFQLVLTWYLLNRNNILRRQESTSTCVLGSVSIDSMLQDINASLSMQRAVNCGT